MLNLLVFGLTIIISIDFTQAHKVAGSRDLFTIPAIIFATFMFGYLSVLAFKSVISSLRERRSLKADLIDGVVCSVTGWVIRSNKNKLDKQRNLPILITPPIILKSNEIPLRALWAFKTDLRYRIFFIPNVNYILSAEIITDEEIAAISASNAD